MDRYPKDPELKGIYVKRCKCGARPYYDRICTSPIIHFIGCTCGRMAVGDNRKQIAIDNWNNDILSKNYQ
jgi:hypothetical protein